MNDKKTLVSFGNICLSNFSEGEFKHSILTKEEAIKVINNSKDLIGISDDDLFAPYNEKQLKKTQKVIEILNNEYKINISFDNFVHIDDDGKFINPINLFKINNDSELVIVEFNFILNERNKSDTNSINNMFEMNKDLIFHIFTKI